jgi:hypothetical protein
MKLFNFYITSAQREYLRKCAKKHKVSMAAVLRAQIDEKAKTLYRVS